jgi:hypothetical protein
MTSNSSRPHLFGMLGNDTRGEGMNDTTSQEKTITAVVTATFALK